MLAKAGFAKPRTFALHPHARDFTHVVCPTLKMLGFLTGERVQLSKAGAGDVSEVIPLQRANKTYLRIVRMLEHTPAIKPDITKADVQVKIMDNVRKDLEDYRVGRALQVLLKAAYVWPKELNQQ